MTASTANTLTNPAVSHSGEVDSLLIERFNGQVHEAYEKGENLLADFSVQTVTGTNMVSNKYMGGTTVQALIAGQEPEATPTSFDKNALVVDTTLLARSTEAMIHRIQSDIEVSGRLAADQSAKLKSIEDQMVIQQLIAGAQTGGTFDGLKFTGGVRRLPDHGVAVKVGVKKTQLTDPYVLMAAIEWVINGLIVQKVPLSGLKVLLPINEFSVLSDMGFINADGISSSIQGMSMSGLTGRLTSYGIPVRGSTEFTIMLSGTANDDTNHHILSNADNGYRYDVTTDIQKARAVVYGRDALLCGRTVGLTSDMFFDKRLKVYFIDTWLSEGCIPDRFDNLGIVEDSGTTATQAEVIAKATAKAKLTKSALAS